LTSRYVRVPAFARFFALKTVLLGCADTKRSGAENS